MRATPGEKVLDLAHVLGVLDGVDGAHADARALAHVVVEAGAPRARKRQVGNGRLAGAALKLAAAALPLGARGRADGHDLAQRVDGVARGVCVGVGAKVARALAVVLAGVLDGGEHVRLGDGDVGVALVVLEVHVEVRVVLGYEVALEHEGLVLGAHHDVVERPHDLHHKGDLVTVVLERHVLAQTGAQVLGLAHVNDLPARVLPEVAARVRGGVVHLAAQLGQALLQGAGIIEVGACPWVANRHGLWCLPALERPAVTAAPARGGSA